MKYEELNRTNSDSFLSLYTESFPSDERRLYGGVDDLLQFAAAHRDHFRCLLAFEGEACAGFVSFWEFPQYVYVEHLAVEPSLRGRGVGTRIMEHLFRTAGGNVVIEVEPPTNPDSRRRISFYDRLGFTLRSEMKYVQPPYSAGQKPVEMCIMTRGETPVKSTADLQPILHHVYNAG